MPDLWFDETYTDRHEHYPRIRPTVMHTNDDQMCAMCGVHAHEIKGELEGHAPDCSWALHHKQREAEGKSIRSVALSHKKYVHQDSISKTDPN
jgi:hypothetical protein